MASKTDQVLRDFKDLSKKSLQRATARALNKTAVSVRAEAAKQARETVKAKAGDLKQLITIDRAQAREGLSKMKAVLRVVRKAIPLYTYGAKPRTVKTDAGPRVGVSVSVKGQRKVVAGGFIATMKSGHVGVFKRKGDARLPIKELFSTTVFDVFTNDGFVDRLKKFARERFEKTWNAELSFERQKKAKG